MLRLRWPFSRNPSAIEDALAVIAKHLLTIERIVMNTDSNVDTILAAWPQLQTDIAALIALAKTAASAIPAVDPRAADLAAQIEAASASIEAVTKPAAAAANDTATAPTETAPTAPQS